MTKTTRIRITIQTERLLVMGRSRILYSACAECGDEVRLLTVDEAALLARVNPLEIHRSVEVGELHSIETTEGVLLVCFKSLNNWTSNQKEGELEMKNSKNRVLVAICCAILVGSLILSRPFASHAQTKPSAKQTKLSRSVGGNSTSFTPQSGGASVKGTGTAGTIPKWLDDSTIGNSVMSEAGGNVGIGTASPGSKLSVAGMVETTLGGYKFPDGTLQSTAAVSGLTSVFHDATLKGTGTSASPLGLNVPLVFDGSSLGTYPVLRVLGKSDDFPGVMTVTDVNPPGPDTTGVALTVVSNNWIAIDGQGQFAGVDGFSPTIGVLATGGEFGVYTHCYTPGCSAVYAYTLGPGSNHAGTFQGDVQITGTLTKGGGSFRIDHPLDPENKYLSHSFVESPDMMNIYNGNVITDGNGGAVITLPEWFEALNKDFRYQLTVIGTFAQAIVAEKIKGNRFQIKTDIPGVEVSWQVTGIRRDAWANKHRIPTEENKSEKERGFYLHPELYNQPEEKNIEWARPAEMVQKMKREREQVKFRQQQ